MKRHLNSNKRKKNNSIVTAAILFTLAFFVIVVASTSAAVYGQVRDNSFVGSAETTQRNAPVVVSGDNIYIAWWTNNTENGNEEVMFRASSDGGQTFGDKINLSNSSNADSWRVEIHGEGENVVVGWWETNQTSDTPVYHLQHARISNDGGQTFGPVLMLAANNTIGSTEEEEEGEGG